LAGTRKAFLAFFSSCHLNRARFMREICGFRQIQNLRFLSQSGRWRIKPKND